MFLLESLPSPVSLLTAIYPYLEMADFGQVIYVKNGIFMNPEEWRAFLFWKDSQKLASQGTFGSP